MRLLNFQYLAELLKLSENVKFAANIKGLTGMQVGQQKDPAKVAVIGEVITEGLKIQYGNNAKQNQEMRASGSHTETEIRHMKATSKNPCTP